jgi:CRP-like cAMP-binding protein
VIDEGASGDRFYVITDGQLLVSIGGRPGATLGPGESFGEIALLRDVPRTATVTALTDAGLLALERDLFLEVVTGHPMSLEAADRVITARIPSDRTPR